MSKVIVSESWDKVLASQYSQTYVWDIQTHLNRDAERLCPKPKDVWNALKLTDFEKVKVVIVGQDPYHDGSAHGLAFSSLEKVTPSLQIIFKELKLEYNVMRKDPNLTDWAEQGVLLLNTALTTVRGQAGAHAHVGWDKLTGHILKMLAKRKTPTVFMLWGKDAKAVGEKYILPNIVSSDHLILKAIHPQAENYSNGQYSFTGCGHFRKANDFLGDHKRGRIKWV